MAKADCLIAEVTLPSLGVGYKIAYAPHLRKIPVLAVFEKDKESQISTMMRDNTSGNYKIIGCQNEEELEKIIKIFLPSLSK